MHNFSTPTTTNITASKKSCAVASSGNIKSLLVKVRKGANYSRSPSLLRTLQPPCAPPPSHHGCTTLGPRLAGVGKSVCRDLEPLWYPWYAMIWILFSKDDETCAKKKLAEPEISRQWVSVAWKLRVHVSVISGPPSAPNPLVKDWCLKGAAAGAITTLSSNSSSSSSRCASGVLTPHIIQAVINQWWCNKSLSLYDIRRKNAWGT